MFRRKWYYFLVYILVLFNPLTAQVYRAVEVSENTVRYNAKWHTHTHTHSHTHTHIYIYIYIYINIYIYIYILICIYIY